MITAFIDNGTIIPYDSIEYVQEHWGDTCIINFAESGNRYELTQGKAQFLEGYKRYLEVKEVIVGIVDADDDDNETPLKRKGIKDEQ